MHCLTIWVIDFLDGVGNIEVLIVFVDGAFPESDIFSEPLFLGGVENSKVGVCLPLFVRCQFPL